MTDEQRMRGQFREWADSGMRYVTDRRNDGAYISTAADDAWEGFRAGQLARDAEVQALREALERLSDGYWRLAEEAKSHLDTSPDVDLIAETTALLRGEEVSEDE